ncbi:heavy metal-binding domain-containing protein [Methanobrevibacter sp. OttesenSCG-928-K11]|nr:heavy metal-binding domain-containing protein [Methanobrevibacter sp. OttesenSCG-928-K11]MDL2271143.1 heavy metal-binding domain-containing protein [Methanobrevibacter sp. OttesenSCG-928-I08]
MKLPDLNDPYTQKAALSIAIGTIAGLITYEVFLILGIDIFGWNLGLIFAPLVAGYVETIIAKELLNESTGAISALILFIVTVVWGFIIANSTLGFNLITAGSIVVILQAAMPILVNFILLGLILSVFYILGIFKKAADISFYKLRNLYYNFTGKSPTLRLKESIEYDDSITNIHINNLGVLFTSTTHLPGKIEEYMGIYEGKIIFRKDKNIISGDFKEQEQKLLIDLKKAKDQSLLNLSEAVKKDGCNGVVNLTIEYDLVGFGGDSFQVVASGTGVRLAMD